MKKLNFAACLVLAVAAPGAALSAQVDGAEQEVTAAERFEALTTEFDLVMRDWRADLRKKMNQAEQAGEELADEEFISPVAEFIPQFEAGAEQYAGTDDAVPFLVWLAAQGGQSDQAVGRKAFATLCSQHHSAQGLDELLEMLPYMNQILGDVNASMRMLVENSTIAQVRESAGFALYSGILDSSASDSPEFGEALTGMKGLLASTSDESLKQMIESKVKIATTFATGMVAPDIAGLDLDGTAFKLSDYKGKVVFLDFWGDW